MAASTNRLFDFLDNLNQRAHSAMNRVPNITDPADQSTHGGLDMPCGKPLPPDQATNPCEDLSIAAEVQPDTHPRPAASAVPLEHPTCSNNSTGRAGYSLPTHNDILQMLCNRVNPERVPKAISHHCRRLGEPRCNHHWTYHFLEDKYQTLRSTNNWQRQRSTRLEREVSHLSAQLTDAMTQLAEMDYEVKALQDGRYVDWKDGIAQLLYDMAGDVLAHRDDGRTETAGTNDKENPQVDNDDDDVATESINSQDERLDKFSDMASQILQAIQLENKVFETERKLLAANAEIARLKERANRPVLERVRAMIPHLDWLDYGVFFRDFIFYHGTRHDVKEYLNIFYHGDIAATYPDSIYDDWQSDRGDEHGFDSGAEDEMGEVMP